MVTIFVECSRTIQNLDGPQKSKIFQRTLQVKWTIGQIVPKVTRLQFYTMTYIWKDKHKSKYYIKKGSGGHLRGQQECPNAEGRTMDKKNNSRSNYVEKNYNNKQIRNSERNQEE